MSVIDSWFRDFPEDMGAQQFFFSPQTALRLAGLVIPCSGRIACLGSPTVFQYCYEAGRDAYLLDNDTRITTYLPRSARERHLPLDMNRCFKQQSDNVPFNLANTFETIVVDPPFDRTALPVLARNINELLDYEAPGAQVFLIQQLFREDQIRKTFERQSGLTTTVRRDFGIDYRTNPLRHRLGTNPIVLFELNKPAGCY